MQKKKIETLVPGRPPPSLRVVSDSITVAAAAQGAGRYVLVVGGARVEFSDDASMGTVEKGKSPTTAAERAGLVQRLAKEEPPVAAQECGKLSHFVHDVLSPP